MSKRNERLKSMQDKREQARALGVDLARRYAVEDLLRSEGIEVPDGAIGLTPVGGVGLVTIKRKVPVHTREVREINGISQYIKRRSGYKEETVRRTQQAITKIRINGGEPVELSEPISLDEWEERFGPLRRKGA